jgi:hypothetical protein
VRNEAAAGPCGPKSDSAFLNGYRFFVEVSSFAQRLIVSFQAIA